MGGFGSGRPSSGRSKVDACWWIDVNHLHRVGCLKPGSWGSLPWTRGGEQIASINLRAKVDRLHLTYRVSIAGGDWQDVSETVRIVRVACRFGGERPYFVCPGVVNGTACGRRVGKPEETSNGFGRKSRWARKRRAADRNNRGDVPGRR
jgi:hypothetical protein